MADFTTLGDVKDWLSTGERPIGMRDDAMLARLITACSVLIESWISRPLGLANWQEIRDGPGGERGYRMQLAVMPVVNVLSLSVDGQAIQSAPTPQLTNQVGFFFDSTSVMLRGQRFSRGIGNVVVQYTAGYNSIPDDVQQICIDMVVRKYRERTRIGERSRSLGGAETVSYDTVMFSVRDIKSDIQALLRQYQQSALVKNATLLPPPPVAVQLEDTTTVVELEDDATPIIGEQPG